MRMGQDWYRCFAKLNNSKPKEGQCAPARSARKLRGLTRCTS